MKKELVYPVFIKGDKAYFYASSYALEKTHAHKAKRWIKGFKSHPVGKTALKKLGDLRSYDQKLFRRFEFRILLECWWAHQFQASGHLAQKALSAEIRRQRDANVQLIEVIGRSHNELERLYSVNPLHVAAIVKPAFEQTIGPLEREAHTEKLLALLEAVRGSLDENIAQQEPAHRMWLGCLDYGKDVEDRNRPANEVRTGLEFALGLRFKRFSGAKNGNPLETFGNRWPSSGKPNYELVALFCKATFNPAPYPNTQTWKNDAKQIERRLTKLRHDYPGLRYVGWPVRI